MQKECQHGELYRHAESWGGEGKVRLEAKYLYALCSVLGTQPGSAGCEQWDSRSFPPALEVCLCPGAGGVRGSYLQFPSQPADS